MEDGTVKHEPTTPVYANPYEATLYGNPYDNTSPIGIPPAPPRLKPKVRWKKIILVSFLLLLIPSSIGAGYIIGNTQWQSGYNQGRSAGYTQGNKNGYNSGYSSGKAAGEADASTAYHNGYTQGNSDGTKLEIAAIYNFLYTNNTSTGKPCRVDSITDTLGNSDYREFRMYQDSNGNYQYECIA